MKNKLKIDRKLTRSLSFERGEVNEDERTVTLSFSSEIAVRRWFGEEILEHTKDAVDLSRLNNKAAVLEDHWSRQIGVVEKAWLGDDKRCYAKLRFSQNQQGEEVFRDIIDDIRCNVSFGYQVKKFIIDDDKENDTKTYRAVKWLPYEISIVSIPADPTVGVGRSLPKAEIYDADIEDNSRREDNDSSASKPLIFFQI